MNFNRYALIALSFCAVIPVQSAFSQAVIQSLGPAEEMDWSQREFWESQNGKPVNEGWQFADGEITLAIPRKGGSILSPPMPPNFELSFQWKIAKGTNSGLKYRVRRFGKPIFNNGYLGLEYQIIDSEPNSTSSSSTASVYALSAPTAEKTLHPPGEWNESRIVAFGDRVEHYLNGKLVSSAKTSGIQWDLTIAKSKFVGSEGFGQPQPGDRFMLTDHGGKVSYRDFKYVRKDDAPAVKPEVAKAPFLGNGMRNSWANQNSIVIWTRTTARPEFVANGTKFISVSRSDAGKLSKETDPTKLHGAQIPEGAELSEMFGACPGSPGKVRLAYFPGRQVNQLKHTDWIETTAESDFTAQWKLDGLKANTQYTVVVEAKSMETDTTTSFRRGTFRTCPKSNDAENLKFCVTTCHDFIRRDDGMKGHKIYPSMAKINPHFIVHAGDIEYYDKPDPWAMTIPLMRFKWQRLFALPNNRDFYSRTTTYFIKDDHDTLTNDSWPGRTYGAVSFAEGVKLFNQEQFPSHPTRYETIQWGKDLQIWILEGRDYRSANDMPDGPEKSILGKEQKQWLFKTLGESKAKFKLIFSPTPIVGPDRDNKKDNHANDIFAVEGQEIRKKLSVIPGAIVLCGDRHWQYASVDPENQLWEFGCGPGSEKHQLGWKAGDERPEHKFLRVAGGFLSGELTYQGKQKEPTLTLRHCKVTGEKVSEFKFPVKVKDKQEADAKPAEAKTKKEKKADEQGKKNRAKKDRAKSDQAEPVQKADPVKK